MKEQLRNEVPVEQTWKLEDLFETPEHFFQEIEALEKQSKEFDSLDARKLEDDELFVKLQELSSVLERVYRVASYASLASSVDMINPAIQEQQSKADVFLNEMASRLAGFEQSMARTSPDKLARMKKDAPTFATYFDDLMRKQAYLLSDQTEQALVRLGSAFELPYRVYNRAKLADLQFEDFEVEGKTYSLSFVLFENHYQYHADPNVRKKAFEAFSRGLRRYEHTIATAYIGQVRHEANMAKLRAHEDVFSYLLFDQKISKEIYDAHLDFLMEHLGPVMRDYAKLLAQVHGIDRLHFADLKVPLDPQFSPEVTIEEAKEDAKKALSVMGDDYLEVVKKALDERWVDWAQNKGKSTGGFCASPYGAHSYILLSWTGLLSEVFTLVHELGHAVHFQFANAAQELFVVEPSLYFIEAPSTINEILFSEYLLKQNEEPRYKRFVYSSLIANTYYHNFVTHFLEAYYQREVYRKVEQGEALSANVLSQITKETLKKFWGDAVVIDDDAALTWMRQPHYYMGLYSYTYSAGLALATLMARKIKEDPEQVERWKEVLRAGGTKSPVELAAVAGVNLKTTDALDASVHWIAELIEQSRQLSLQLES